MNAKLCKRLRRLARASVGKNALHSEYEHKQVHQKVLGFNTLADGSKAPILGTVHTAQLKQGCFKYRYKQLKRGARHANR